MRFRRNIVLCVLSGASVAVGANTCDQACINGSCTGSNECTCYTGWSGLTCDTPDDADSICDAAPDLTVDPSSYNFNNYPSLSDALAVAQPGNLILVKNGAHTVSNTIDVSITGVTICGESRQETVLRTAGDESDPSAILSVRADNVRIARLRMEHVRSDITGSAISVLDPTDTTKRIMGFSMDSVTLEFQQTGVSIRGENWSVANSLLVCNDACLFNDGIGVKALGSVGVNQLRTSEFASAAEDTIIRAITVGSSAPTDHVDGQLLIRANKLAVGEEWKNPRALYFGIHNFNRENDSQIEIVFENNEVPNSPYGSLYFNPAATFRQDYAGDAIKSVTIGNTFVELYEGYCLGYILSLGGYKFRSSALPVTISKENLVYSQSGKLADFSLASQVAGSTKGEFCYSASEEPSAANLASAEIVVTRLPYDASGRLEVCDGSLFSDPSWYWALNECAVGQVDSITGDYLRGCIEEQNFRFFPDWKLWNFLTLDKGADCLQCAVSFAESARIRLQESDPFNRPVYLTSGGVNCPSEAGHEQWEWENRFCQRVLYYQIEDMNVCMANGKNIASGGANHRCSVQDDIDIQSRYDIYNGMYTVIAAGTYTVDNYGSAFDKIPSADDFNTFIQSFPCKVCFDNWFTQASVEGVDATYGRFQKCYGTHAPRTFLSPLSESQKKLFVDYYPSYYVIKTCFAACYDDYDRFKTCMEDRTGIPFLSETPHVLEWVHLANAQHLDCKDVEAFSPECTNKLAHVGFQTPAALFESVYQSQVYLVNPRCSAGEYAELKNAVSVQDVVSLGLSSGSEIEAAENVVSQLIPNALNGLPCVPCYRALAGLSFRNATEIAACATDLASAECTAALGETGRPYSVFRQCVTRFGRDIEYNENLNNQVCTPNCPTVSDMEDSARVLEIAQAVLRGFQTAPVQLGPILASTNLNDLDAELQQHAIKISIMAIVNDGSSALYLANLLTSNPEDLTRTEQNIVTLAQGVYKLDDLQGLQIMAAVAVGDVVDQAPEILMLNEIVNRVTDGSFTSTIANDLVGIMTGSFDNNVKLLANAANLREGLAVRDDKTAYGFVDLMNGSSTNSVLDLIATVAGQVEFTDEVLSSLRSVILDGRAADSVTLERFFVSAIGVAQERATGLADSVLTGYRNQERKHQVINALAFVTSS